MDHAPRFLQVVDEARTRVRETTVEAVRARQASGEAFTLVDLRRNVGDACGGDPSFDHLCLF